LGLTGGVTFDPTLNGGGDLGVRVQGIGRNGSNGEPLMNFDFIPPSQAVGDLNTEGRTIESNFFPSGGGNDFSAFAQWTGEIQDLIQLPPNSGSFGGSTVPNPAGPFDTTNRVEDFIVINSTGAGNGVVDGVAESGFGLDLIEFGEPVISASPSGFGTSIIIDMQFQAYKLGPSGKRIEEQERVPSGFNIYANRGIGTFDYTILRPIDEVRTALINGEVLEGGTYNLTVAVNPIQIVVEQNDEVPEPSTLISLLLFGGAFATFSKRKPA
jgi:hypothetical protein